MTDFRAHKCPKQEQLTSLFESQCQKWPDIYLQLKLDNVFIAFRSNIQHHKLFNIRLLVLI